MFVIIIILLPKCCLIFANFSTICSIIVIFQHSNTVIVFLLIPQSLSGLFAYLVTGTRSIQLRLHNYLGQFMSHVASILHNWNSSTVIL